MKYCLLLLLTGIAGISFSQKQVLSGIPKSAAVVSAFIPKGYDTLQTVEGDLDKDGINDVVLALKNTMEDSVDTETEEFNRVLVILFRKWNNYELKAVSDKSLLCRRCGGVFGDPFAGITITNGVLIIDHYGGSSWKWAYTHKFRYQQSGFFLIGKTTHSFFGADMCEDLGDFAGTNFEDVNLVTGDFEKKRISEDCRLLENRKGKKPKKALISLAKFSIEDGS